MLLAGAACLVTASTAAAQSKQPVHTYEIPLLDKTTFLSQMNEWKYFFELKPGIHLVGNQFVELHYSASPTILPGQGSITVLINGTPVDSHKVGGQSESNISWRVSIPTALFKPDAFNELRIVSRQRSVAGPCQDTENYSNWIRFEEGNKLHLEREEPPVFPLNLYPFPYLDQLSPNPVQATVVLPNGAQPDLVAEALGLASDWGRYERIRGLPMRIALGAMVPGQNVIIGNLPQQSTAGIQGPGGFIQAYPDDYVGRSRLWVTGTDKDSIHISRKALAYPEMVEQFSGYKATVSPGNIDELRNPTTRLGTFTFTELGSPNTVLSGIGFQPATMTIQRPIQVDLGRESYLTVRFRHADNLNPLRSLLSVKINGVPVGSARLENANANGGFIRVRIPVTELAKNLWQVELAAYHDLAEVDCSKSYVDVAWTVIEGDSTLELSPGQLYGRPYLDSFPYLVGKDGIAPARCDISFSPNPSATQLSIGADIAARASQVNRHTFDWDVTYGTIPQSKASSIIIGTYDEVARFAPISKALLIAPTGNDGFSINGKLRIVKEALKGGAILQAVRSPYSDGAVLYVMMGANDDALNRFAAYLTDPKKAITLTGEVAIMTADGRLTTLSTLTDADMSDLRTKEQNSYTPVMIGVMILILLIIFTGIVLFARQFVKRTPKTTETSV